MARQWVAPSNSSRPLRARGSDVTPAKYSFLGLNGRLVKLRPDFSKVGDPHPDSEGVGTVSDDCPGDVRGREVGPCGVVFLGEVTTPDVTGAVMQDYPRGTLSALSSRRHCSQHGRSDDRAGHGGGQVPEHAFPLVSCPPVKVTDGPWLHQADAF